MIDPVASTDMSSLWLRTCAPRCGCAGPSSSRPGRHPAQGCSPGGQRRRRQPSLPARAPRPRLLGRRREFCHFCHFCGHPLSMPIATPARWRGGCSSKWQSRRRAPPATARPFPQVAVAPWRRKALFQSTKAARLSMWSCCIMEERRCFRARKPPAFPPGAAVFQRTVPRRRRRSRHELRPGTGGLRSEGSLSAAAAGAAARAARAARAAVRAAVQAEEPQAKGGHLC